MTKSAPALRYRGIPDEGQGWGRAQNPLSLEPCPGRRRWGDGIRWTRTSPTFHASTPFQSMRHWRSGRLPVGSPLRRAATTGWCLQKTNAPTHGCNANRRERHAGLVPHGPKQMPPMWTSWSHHRHIASKHHPPVQRPNLRSARSIPLRSIGHLHQLPFSTPRPGRAAQRSVHPPRGIPSERSSCRFQTAA